MKRTITIITCCIIGLTACNVEKGGAKPILDEKGIKFAKIALDEELKYSIEGNIRTAIKKETAMMLLELNDKVTSTGLSKAYQANELSADEKYKNKKILVTGRVQSITRLFDTPHLFLNGAGMFQSVAARFYKESEGELANMSEGQNVRIVCREPSYGIAQVTLRNCRTFSSYYASMIESVSKIIPDVIAGKKSVPPELDKVIKIAYNSGKFLSEDSICFSDIGSKQCRKEHQEATKKLFLKMYEKYLPENSACFSDILSKQCQKKDLKNIPKEVKEKAIAEMRALPS